MPMLIHKHVGGKVTRGDAIFHDKGEGGVVAYRNGNNKNLWQRYASDE